MQNIDTAGTLQYGGAPLGVLANTSAGAQRFDKTWMYAMRRNGNATPETMRFSLGIAPPIHHITDPTTAASRYNLVFESLVEADIAVGSCRVFCGICQYVTAGVANTLLGVGFYADSDHIWHSFIHDSAAGTAPVTVVRNTTLSPLTTSLHRMKIVFDGNTKMISWYIDGTLVDSYTPVAPFERMAPAANLVGPEVMIGAVVPASGDVTVRCFGGALPVLRALGTTPPAVLNSPLTGQLWPRTIG